MLAYHELLIRLSVADRKLCLHRFGVVVFLRVERKGRFMEGLFAILLRRNGFSAGAVNRFRNGGGCRPKRG